MKLPPIREDGFPLLHNLMQFKAEPLEFWLETGQIAPVIRTRLGPREFWVITDPDWMEYIFKTKPRTFPREERLRRTGRMDEAYTVFTAETYEQWLTRRRLLQPAFHRRQIATFATTMVEEAARIVGEWERERPFDLKSQMKTLTMRIIGRTMFSVDMQETAMLQETFELASEFSYEQMAAVLPIPLWVPTPYNRKVQASEDLRLAHLGKIVEERYASGEPKADLLDMLIAARVEEDGAKFTPRDLLREMMSIIFAGHETTALTLMWFFYRLTQHPEVEARVLQEVETALNGRLPTLEDLPNMPYIDRVLQEVLRLHPPVYATVREAEEDEQFGGYDIPAKTKFLLNIRGLHVNGRYWQDPHTFDPDRFSPERSADRHKYAFQPFISGAKKCIGDNFAMMEMRLIVPTILQQTRLRYAGTTPPKAVAGFVMETEGEVLVEAMTL